eukprot:COSAG04_NODE_559_length_12608_cov_12.306499_13_plen_160_part_00
MGSGTRTFLAFQLIVAAECMLVEYVDDGIHVTVRPLSICKIPRCLAAPVADLSVAPAPYELLNDLGLAVLHGHVEGCVVAEAVLQIQRTGKLAALRQLVQETLEHVHVSTPNRAMQRHRPVFDRRCDDGAAVLLELVLNIAEPAILDCAVQVNHCLLLG